MSEISEVNLEEAKKGAQIISFYARALSGRPLDPDSVATLLIDKDNLLERSRFPNYPNIRRQVYLRLMRIVIGEEAETAETMADLEAHALIAYKGQSREEFTKIKSSAASAGDSQSITLGFGQPETPPKRRFYQRQPKKPASEFEE